MNEKLTIWKDRIKATATVVAVLAVTWSAIESALAVRAFRAVPFVDNPNLARVRT